jgi:CheY-like chemotaxis protein
MHSDSKIYPQIDLAVEHALPSANPFESTLPVNPHVSFEETKPLDWEQQAMAPDFDEIIAAMAMGEVAPEPDYSDRKRVLVVDDDLAARLYLRAKLALLDTIDVYEACSGSEALEIIQNTSFDGVLLDVNLPDQDGYAVCKAIKRQNRGNNGKPPKIYVVTSRNGVVDRVRASFAGADAFLSKPPHPGQLHELLLTL